jgi:MoxR-like ATPase
MFNVLVDYPEEDEELKIVEMTTSVFQPQLERVLSATDILEMQDIVRKVPVAEYVIRYAMKFTRLTRKEKGTVPEFIRNYVTWGAGPRATQYLVLGAKARAVLHGRYYVSCEDIREVAIPVLRHRIITNFNAEAEGVKPEDIVRRLADIIPRDPNEEQLAKVSTASAPAMPRF